MTITLEEAELLGAIDGNKYQEYVAIFELIAGNSTADAKDKALRFMIEMEQAKILEKMEK